MRASNRGGRAEGGPHQLKPTVYRYLLQLLADQSRRVPFPVLGLLIVLALIASHPRLALVIISYTYVAFACVMWGVSKLGKRHGVESGPVEEPHERYTE